MQTGPFRSPKYLSRTQKSHRSGRIIRFRNFANNIRRSHSPPAHILLWVCPHYFTVALPTRQNSSQVTENKGPQRAHTPMTNTATPHRATDRPKHCTDCALHPSDSVTHLTQCSGRQSPVDRHSAKDNDRTPVEEATAAWPAQCENYLDDAWAAHCTLHNLLQRAQPSSNITCRYSRTHAVPQKD